MADLDRTTFYRSFESKDDVLDYYLDRQMTLLAGQLPAYSTLEKNLTALFRWTYAERKNLCVLMGLSFDQFFQRCVEREDHSCSDLQYRIRGRKTICAMARFIAG